MTATTATGRKITLQKVCAGVYAAGYLDRTTGKVAHYGAAGERGSYLVCLYHPGEAGTYTTIGHADTLANAARTIAAHVDTTTEAVAR
jgi:hypothetical protein